MIIHLDLDCFFVSAERVRTKELRGKPVVVCKSGDTKIFSTANTKTIMTTEVRTFNSLFQHEKEFKSYSKDGWKSIFVDDGKIHGIVIAKSYEAKTYGIKTGTLLKDALVMCPNLYVVEGDHLYYQLKSIELKEYLQTKIPILEQYSIDEFWGDISGYIKDKDIYNFVKNLQIDILNDFELSISIGISNSKWLAKYATDFNKPLGITLIHQDNVLSFIKDKKIETFPGIGRGLSKKLNTYKINTLDELLNARKLVESFGKIGVDLIKRVSGEDKEAVSPYRDRSSIGISRNFAGTLNREELKRKVIILSRHLSYNIAKLKLTPTTFYLKINYENGLKSKSSFSTNRFFSEQYFKELMIEYFLKLDIYKHHRVNHISINVSNFLEKKSNKTLSLLNINEDIKSKDLDKQLLKLRDKYGVDIVRSAIEKESI